MLTHVHTRAHTRTFAYTPITRVHHIVHVHNTTWCHVTGLIRVCRVPPHLSEDQQLQLSM